MCNYITPVSSPPPREPSDLPRVGVGVESGPFPLSVGCYWWGEVMDLPAVFTGILRINQTVGKPQPAIPPLSRLNCHFISFIYGGSALLWTPPLSNLPLKMLLFFFFLPYKVLWQPIHTPVHLSSFFPGKHSPSFTSAQELVPDSQQIVWKWRCEQPGNRQLVIMRWTKGYKNSVTLWSTEGPVGLLTWVAAVQVQPALWFRQSYIWVGWAAAAAAHLWAYGSAT